VPAPPASSSKSRPPARPARAAADPRRLLGLRIKELRALRGLTQEEAADCIGVFRTYMSRMESGQANPTLTMLHQIAAALGVEVAELLTAPTGPAPPRVTSVRPKVSRGRVSK
jgi:transcriptional regulator with XRE-family HTH domain